MKVWESIRLRCRRDGEKIKSVARDLGLAPNTVRKYLRQDTPPKARMQRRPKLLDRYQSHVDELLRSTPRITAARVGSYLRQNVDADLQVGERALRVYVADRRAILVPKEAFIRATYALLGLQTYFTAGEKEVRAWTIKGGWKAPQAAGVIHTDFEKGFIKAEVVSYAELSRLGSVAAAREAGKYRLEGKEYVFQDGDVALFRFNN